MNTFLATAIVMIILVNIYNQVNQSMSGSSMWCCSHQKETENEVVRDLIKWYHP